MCPDGEVFAAAPVEPAQVVTPQMSIGMPSAAGSAVPPQAAAPPLPHVFTPTALFRMP